MTINLLPDFRKELYFAGTGLGVFFSPGTELGRAEGSFSFFFAAQLHTWVPKGGTGSTWSHRTFESSAALTLTIPPKKEIRNNKSGTNHFLAQSFAATYDIQPASANGKNREGKANSVQRTPSPHTCQCIIAQYCAYRILPQFTPQPHFVITRRTFPGRKNCSYKSPHYSYFSNLCKYDCYRTHQNFEAPAYFLYAQYAIPVVFTSARELRVNRRGCQIWSSRNERRGGFGKFSIMNLDRKKCVWCPVLESIQRVCISPGENNCLKPPPAATRDASRPWMGQTPPPTFDLPLDKLYQYLYSSTLAGGCR